MVRLTAELTDEPGSLSYYQQIAQHLRDAIASGELPPGARLPTQRVLCEHYDVAPMTVTAAIRTLEVQGLITGQQGRARYVSVALDGVLTLSDLEGLADHSELTLGKVAAIERVVLHKEHERVSSLVGRLRELEQVLEVVVDCPTCDRCSRMVRETLAEDAE